MMVVGTILDRPSRLLSLALPLLLVPPGTGAWEPTWESLDSRPLPPWYDEAKFGIFLHWGVFSVPSFHSEWFWHLWRSSSSPDVVSFVERTERPGFAYQEYASRFRAELYDPSEWADLFAAAGAQYVVLTAKHHEGYCMWDSRDVPATWNWNAADVGPRRDLLGDLAAAVRGRTSPRTGRQMRFGAYHSLFEWFNPDYLRDMANNFTTTRFRDRKSIPELYDLVDKYGPEIIWSDGQPGPDSYWNAPEFLAWYATNSSVAETAVWNDRWADGSGLKHGAFYSGPDHYQPGRLLPHKWENALPLDSNSWGYARDHPYASYHATEFLIHELAETVAFGGNMLLNVGPGSDGTIDPIFHDRLLGVGAWLGVNGEAIYSTKPWATIQNETAAGVFYTARPESRTVYAIATRWPGDGRLRLEAPLATPQTEVRMLGWDGDVMWSLPPEGNPGILIVAPKLTPNLIPCRHAWVFAMAGLANGGAYDAQSTS